MARTGHGTREGGRRLLVAVLAAHFACGHAFGTSGPAFVASSGRWMALSSPGRLQGTPFSVARGAGTARLGLSPHGSRLDPSLYSRVRSIPAAPLLANGGGVIGAKMIEAGDEVSGWDVERVASWLDAEGFSEEWVGSFRDNEIDGFALSLLKDPDQLDAMGIPKPMGSRLKFWQKLDVLLSAVPGGTAAAVEAEAPIAAVAAAASSAAPPAAPSPPPSSSSSYSSSAVNELYSAPPREASPSPPPAAAPGFDLYSAPERAATPQAEAPAAPVAQMDVASSEQQVEKFMAGTETLVREAASVAGAALPVPVSAESIEALVADEVAFIDNMCQLLADLDAKDREVTLLLDLKSNLQNLFSVVVVGEFNAGKSSMINALLGSKFCKEGVVPTTATINMLRYGEGEETGKSMRNKDYVELFLPVPLLKQVTIVDTPGTNAIIKEQTRLTKGFIPQSDLILFVTSAERPLTETEGKLMEYITTWGKKVVMVLNKVDLFQGNEGDKDTVTEFVRENAEKILGTSPPVFAVAGREALKAKLGRSDGSVSEAEAEAMWKLSNFEELEGYITRTLGDRKEAAKVKLESPLGVAERFLNTYEQASSMGAKVSAEDVEAIGEVKASLEQYEREVQAELQAKLAKLDDVLTKVQTRTSKTIAGVLSPGYVTNNLVACLTKSTSVGNELRAALDVSFNQDVREIVTGFGSSLRDKESARWALCSALINERLRGRGWNVELVRPNVDAIIEQMEESMGSEGGSSNRLFDPEVETVLLSDSVTKKAWEIAAGSSGVGGAGLLMLEVFNAGFLDFLAFLTTIGGVGFFLGVYPSVLQDQVAQELEERAKSWKARLQEDVGKVLREAADQSVFEMEQAFMAYTDAVKADENKWKMVAERVKESEAQLQSLKQRIDAL